MQFVYNPEYHTPGRNIQLLRKKYALSRRALANLLGTNDIVLKMIEEENLPPVLSSKMVRRLSEIFPLPEGKDIFSPDLFD